MTINPFIQACRDGDLEKLKGSFEEKSDYINKEGGVELDCGEKFGNTSITDSSGKRSYKDSELFDRK